VPLLDVRTGQIDGVLLSEARIKKIWDLIAGLQVSPGQSVYIVNAQNEVVAHRNPSVVLRSTIFDAPGQDGVQPGLTGLSTVLAVEKIRLGQQELNIVVEQEWSEALDPAINSVYIIGAVIVVALVVAGILGFLIVRQIVRPIQAMATTAQAISAGDLSQQVKITGQDEIGVLAGAFNGMTSQLSDLIDSLEARVATRTQRLEIIASLSERLTAILDLETLLMEMVNQVKEAFGYYHAQVYLLDEQRQRLVMTAGVGEAGAKMKTAGHHILLDTPTSLVARAARTGEVVLVDNVQEAVDWLPNPLLPETHAELAVPIILEGQVVGVLDVQDNEVAGLDEGDANLLRSLASQVAVGMRNARLFAEVETELVQARAAQEKYIERVWQQRKEKDQQLQHLHVRSVAAPALAEATLAQAKQLALAQNRPALVTLAGIETDSTSIVAPVTLSGKTIGVLQVHRLDSTGGAETETPPWTDEDLAVVETVLDQVAQAAESLRLFEETNERASFEQLVGDISDKLRQAPTLNILAKTAAEELGRVLGVSHSLVKLGVTLEKQQFSEPVTSLQPQNGVH
jgi:GAF domain-containing protein/HAMP domain-containing protein